MVSVPSSRGHGWAVLALSETADGVSRAELARDLRRRLPSGEFFFPDPPHEPEHALRGYAFVIAAYADHELTSLERSRYVAHVLRSCSRCPVDRITDRALRVMMRNLSTTRPPVGATVEILTGDWCGVRGLVVQIRQDEVTVEVNLWSRQRLLDLPAHDLRVV